MEYIIGAFVALGIEWLKGQTKISGVGTMFVLALVSVVAAGVYVGLSHYTSFWPVLTQVLTVAGAFHNFIIRQYKS